MRGGRLAPLACLLAAAPCVAPAARVDVVVDLSGSMAAHSREVAERIATSLAPLAGPDDALFLWRAGAGGPQGPWDGGSVPDLARAAESVAPGGGTDLVGTLEAVSAVPHTGPRRALVLTDGADGDPRFVAAAGGPDPAGSVAMLWRSALAGFGGPVALDLVPAVGAGGSWDLTPLYRQVLGDGVPDVHTPETAAALGFGRALCLRPFSLDFGDLVNGPGTAVVRPVWSDGEAVPPQLSARLVGAPRGMRLESASADGGETIELTLVGRPPAEARGAAPRDFAIAWDGPEGVWVEPREQPAAFLWNPPETVCRAEFGEAGGVGWEGPGPLATEPRDLRLDCPPVGVEGATLRLLGRPPPGLRVEALGPSGEVVSSVSAAGGAAPLPGNAASLRLSWDAPRRWQGEVAVEVVGPSTAGYEGSGPPRASWALDVRPPLPWWVWLVPPALLLAAAVALRPRFASSLRAEAETGRVRPARAGRHALPWAGQACDLRADGGVLRSRGGDLLGRLVATRGGPVLELAREATVKGLARPAGRRVPVRDGDQVAFGGLVVTFHDRRQRRRPGRGRRT